MLQAHRRATFITAAILGSASLHLSHAQEPTGAATEDPWLASGCSMAQETALMLCLGDYASIPPAAPSSLPELGQATYYCDIYQQLANCWATGVYCKEWYPMQLAADKFCALANMSSSSLKGVASQTTTTLPASSEIPGVIGAVAGLSEVTPTPAPTSVASVLSAINTLSSIIEEASNVITSIWNNDSGTDIPVISNDIATVTRASWTHMTESTPLPATDPLGSTVIGDTSTSLATPTARIRRKIHFGKA